MGKQENYSVRRKHHERIKNGLVDKQIYQSSSGFSVVKADSGEPLADIHFQEGPIQECGVNGVCNEDLINMVICRLEHFQQSGYRCRENALAITSLEEALLWLRKRTIARENRGIEGTHNV